MAAHHSRQGVGHTHQELLVVVASAAVHGASVASGQRLLEAH